MSDVRLAPRARADLRDIGRFTQRRWGVAQRTTILTQLDAAFRLLAAKPGLGPERTDIRAGLRCHPHGPHRIFYRIDNETVTILRVLHHSRDVDGGAI